MDLINTIKSYPQIVLYRHINPDDDALGSQMGLYYFIKDNFPEINVVLMGTCPDDLAKKYAFHGGDAWKDASSLGIVMDTSNKERVDGDLSRVDQIIKIDHHIVVESFGDINIEDPTASSCAQIITLMIADTADAYQLSPLGARALYMGIVGDTNRFMYSSTDARTFRAAAFLMDCGINLKEISQAMYLTNKKDLDVKAYILNHYQVRGDIAYYLLRQSELEALGISRTEGSNYIHELADIEEFKIWMAVTENTDGTYRISLRSRDYNVRKAAVAFNGGGHVLASGASMSSLAQLDELLDYLQRIIDERIMA